MTDTDDDFGDDNIAERLEGLSEADAAVRAEALRRGLDEYDLDDDDLDDDEFDEDLDDGHGDEDPAEAATAGSHRSMLPGTPSLVRHLHPPIPAALARP